MKSEKNGTLYLNLILGSIGIILLALGIFEFLAIVESSIASYILTLLGFITIVHYIYYLEKKAGISNKLIWIRAIILIIVLASLYFSFYK